MRVKLIFYMEDSLGIVYVEKRLLKLFWYTTEAHQFDTLEKSITFAENQAKQLGFVDVIRIMR